MNILIIEDEQPAVQKLIRLLREVDPSVEIIAVLRSVEEATNWFLSNPDPELIFMDIQLEDGLCFEIFEQCRINVPVIFTTAYDEYALKAFKVNSVDYLLKPVRPEELKEAMDKFKRIHHPAKEKADLETIIRQLQPQIKERFLVQVGEQYRSIPASSISCFFILERNTFILTDQGKSYPIEYSLDKVEQIVNPKLFFRVNRHFIVNFHAIREIIKYSSHRLKIMLNSDKEPETEIIVSRERVSEFKEWLNR